MAAEFQMPVFTNQSECYYKNLNSSEHERRHRGWGLNRKYQSNRGGMFEAQMWRATTPCDGAPPLLLTYPIHLLSSHDTGGAARSQIPKHLKLNLHVGNVVFYQCIKFQL
jgi:hypothetical protein